MGASALADGGRSGLPVKRLPSPSLVGDSMVLSSYSSINVRTVEPDRIGVRGSVSAERSLTTDAVSVATMGSKQVSA